MICRVSISVKGAVQGVGFRPFIFKLVKDLGLNGYVLNNESGVYIEAEGGEKKLQNFLSRIRREKPSLSIITSLEHSFLDPIGYQDFTIKESDSSRDLSAIILPDISVCNACLTEMIDPSNRRYCYPFINCTNCGPRFSIIEALPYDRLNTSMKNFAMCDKCKAEYDDPANRRFHAQPNACPKCGPSISFLDGNGKLLAEKENSLKMAAKKILSGKIVAIKGLGGFQLICDATNDEAVKKLRKRKGRKEKPFALMFDSFDSVRKVCHVSQFERRVLLSVESPIVLLEVKRQTSPQGVLQTNGKRISFEVAPNNPYLGIMLPYTPLHHLLMTELKIPIIATSGNLSEEPICIDNEEALERLHGIADYFLVHNRPIVRHVDDSIVRIVLNREMIIRRARGYAPLPLQVKHKKSENILAVGGHLKNTIALKRGEQIFISQHIGDLSTRESTKAFNNVITDFQKLYNTKPKIAISDSHPDYLSTKYASSLKGKPHTIQHHKAHVAACRLENQVQGDALGVSWDGTGFGEDGTVWGGEFFLSTDSSIEHIAQFRKFKLPGGETAIEEPRRSLAGILFEMGQLDNPILQKVLKPAESKIIRTMLENSFNSPETSSVGRIFDAVSALLGICLVSEFEGQAAMMVEFAANVSEKKSYDFNFLTNKKVIVDWEPTFKAIIEDKKAGVNNSIISAKFHNALAYVVDAAAEHFKLKKIILSGGCFQNKFLLERTIRLLNKKNKKVYWHQRIPTNDGGISTGQIAAYLIERK